MDAAGPVDLGEELIQIALGLQVAVAGHGRKEKLPPRFVHDPDASIGVDKENHGQLLGIGIRL